MHDEGDSNNYEKMKFCVSVSSADSSWNLWTQKTGKQMRLIGEKKETYLAMRKDSDNDLIGYIQLIYILKLLTENYYSSREEVGMIRCSLNV